MSMSGFNTVLFKEYRTSKANKKFQSTAGSAVRFQRSFYINVQCVSRVYRISASGH